MQPADGHLDPVPQSPPGLPAFLTVEEAADLLRIGRTTAYALTKQWRATNGEAGLPVVNVGHKLRVPLHQLEALAGGCLDPQSDDAAPPPAALADDVPTPPLGRRSPSHGLSDTDSATSPAPSSRRRRRQAASGQASLFGEAS